MVLGSLRLKPPKAVCSKCEEPGDINIKTNVWGMVDAD